MNLVLLNKRHQDVEHRRGHVSMRRLFNEDMFGDAVGLQVARIILHDAKLLSVATHS